jgi:hypothetical protein
MIDTVKTFNPSSHLIQISTSQGKKDYLPVQFRLVWFRQECPQGTITTELLDLDRNEECEAEVSVWNDNTRKYDKVIKYAKGVAVFKATVSDGKGGIATGTKMENAAAFADYLEKGETGAIGRALCALGYGTQFAPELDEGDERIVDAPVQRQPSYDPDKPCSESQLTTITKLYRDLGQEPMPCVDMTFGDCAALLKELSKRVQAARK